MNLATCRGTIVARRTAIFICRTGRRTTSRSIPRICNQTSLITCAIITPSSVRWNCSTRGTIIICHRTKATTSLVIRGFITIITRFTRTTGLKGPINIWNLSRGSIKSSRVTITITCAYSGGLGATWLGCRGTTRYPTNIKFHHTTITCRASW